jgi:hypothetical protein
MPRKRLADDEAFIISKILQLLANLDPTAQRRVASYVMERAGTIGPMHKPEHANGDDHATLPFPATDNE